MPAATESRLSKVSEKNVQRLGIIAGGGTLPRILVHACEQSGIEVFIIAFDGQTDAALTQGRRHLVTRLGAAGQIIETLHNHNISDLVLIGSIRRPSLAELRPDLRTAQFFAKVGLKALGDDGLLKALRGELENEGFTIHGVQSFVTDLIAPAGDISRHKAKKQDWNDIKRGIEIARALGRLDIGQSVIVQEDIVLGVEAAEGTDELIRRCTGYRRAGRGGVLVKACKPQQDHDLDLPAIGPETVRLCAETGLAGIVIEADRNLVIDRPEVARLANELKLFVSAIDFDGDSHAA